MQNTDFDFALAAALHLSPSGLTRRLDGVSFEFAYWWFNVRASNTEPVVRLNLEAANDAEMCARRDAVLARIAQFAQ